MGTKSKTDYGKGMKSILKQEMKLNCKVKVQNHIHAQVQFQERTTCQNINLVLKILI